MSDNVLSFGIMCPLVQPVGNYRTGAWADLSDKLEEHGLHINYEGTLVYSDKTSEDDSGLVFLAKDDYSMFVEQCKSIEVECYFDEYKIYTAYWYDGADSDMAEMTLEKFNTAP